MESPRVIESGSADFVRIVQVTDCHLFADAEASLLGMNTRESLRAVNALIRERDSGADLLLATGDLSQDGSAESYRHFAREIDALGWPAFWIPGNHDEGEAMAANFGSSRLDPAKRVLVGGWQLVLLDSTLAGEVCGRVSTEQLDFMDASLRDHPERHALVCLHHQAIESGCRWLDLKGLRDAATLRARIGAHAQVRGVLWGHVHQAFQQQRDGIEWMSTPSTCVQFKPGADEFALDTTMPGYRSLTLHADGRIETSVRRITDFDFEVDDAVKAY